MNFACCMEILEKISNVAGEFFKIFPCKIPEFAIFFQEKLPYMHSYNIQNVYAGSTREVDLLNRYMWHSTGRIPGHDSLKIGLNAFGLSEVALPKIDRLTASNSIKFFDYQKCLFLCLEYYTSTTHIRNILLKIRSTVSSIPIFCLEKCYRYI